MTVFDPYDVLGVGKAARHADIKQAYRRKVQVAHPDRGGDPEHFVLVVRAFGLLSDPDSRRLFDETGIIDDEAVTSYRREVAAILADMFDAAVETAIATRLKLENVDFIAQMSAAVQTGLADARLSMARTDTEIGALQTLLYRLETETPFASAAPTKTATSSPNASTPRSPPRPNSTAPSSAASPCWKRPWPSSAITRARSN